MSTAAETVDPMAAKLAIVLDALSRIGVPLSRSEEALADELDSLPAVRAARAAFREHMAEARRREEQDRIDALRAEQARIEAECNAEVEARRAEWKAADPLIRALHLLAKELRPDKFGERLLRLAEMIENPSITLRKPGGVHPWGERYAACDRPPPATFRSIAAHLDPEDGYGL
jgi:uncharacterized protein YPO0396